MIDTDALIARWRQWVAAFEAAVVDDGWQRLAPFLTEDVRYIVAGVPFACDLQGRDAVIAGFARSIANFDRRLDSRQWFGVGIRAFAPGAVTGRACGVYTWAGAPPLSFGALSSWFYRGEAIALMTDIYDAAEADAQAALAWIATHGPDLDPSYA